MFEIEECLVTFWTVFQPCTMVDMDGLDNAILFIGKVIHHRYHGEILKATALSWTAPPLIFRNMILKIMTFIF